jgi:membrane protein implicated in regulation of membrane protease activity
MIAVAPLQGGLIGPEALPLLLIVAGLVLSIAEAMAPGAHFIVVGIALLGAGLTGLVLGPLASPFVLGFLVLIFGALALYGYHELSPIQDSDSSTPISSDSLKGQAGTVTERVTATEGQVRLEGGGFNPHYAARAMDDDIPEGTEVIVVDPGGGNVVTVTPLENDVDEIDRELNRGREQLEDERLEQPRQQREDDIETETTEPSTDSDATDAD